MEQQAEQWREYLDHKNKMRKLRFVLSGQYGSNLINKQGFYLDLYDVQQRYKLGGNDAIHKLKDYGHSEQR